MCDLCESKEQRHELLMPRTKQIIRLCEWCFRQLFCASLITTNETHQEVILDYEEFDKMTPKKYGKRLRAAGYSK